MNKKIIAVLAAVLFLAINSVCISFSSGSSKVIAADKNQNTLQTLLDINTMIKKVMGTAKDNNIIPKANVNQVISSVKDMKQVLSKCYSSGKDLNSVEYGRVIKDVKNIDYSYFCAANNAQLLNLFLELDGLYTLYNNFKKAGSAKFKNVYLALGINKFVINTPVSNLVFGVENIYNVYQNTLAPVMKNINLTDLKSIGKIKDALSSINWNGFESINPEGLVKRANLYELTAIAHSIATLKKVSDILSPILSKLNNLPSLPSLPVKLW